MHFFRKFQFLAMNMCHFIRRSPHEPSLVHTKESFLVATAGVLAFLLVFLGQVETQGGKNGPGTTAPATISFISRNQNFGTIDANIMAVSESGGKATTLVSRAGRPDEVGPRWSPDGRRLLFTRGGSLDNAIVSVAENGSDERIIVTFRQVDEFNVTSGRPTAFDQGVNNVGWQGVQDAAWSPDATSIVFCALVAFPDPWENPPAVILRNRVFTYNLLNGEIAQVTPDDDPNLYAWDNYPHWSEALDVIVYVREYTDLGLLRDLIDLSAVTPDGSESWLLVSDAAPGTLGIPVWSHSGDPLTGRSSLVFASEGAGAAPGDGRVFVIDVDLSLNEPVTGITTLTGPNGMKLFQPAWSPDDSRLVMRRLGSKTNQIASYELTSGVWTVLVQGDPAKTLYGAPDWRRLP